MTIMSSSCDDTACSYSNIPYERPQDISSTAIEPGCMGES